MNKIRIKYKFLLIIFFLFLTGCSAVKKYKVGSVPNSPEEFIFVRVDSIPSGADVFLINNDNSIGKRIGKTPMDFKIGIAAQFFVLKKDRKPFKVRNVFAWGEGIYWVNHDLFLRLALYKDGNMFGLESKKLLSKYARAERRRRKYWPANRFKSESVSWTVPLKSVEQWKAELTAIAIRNANQQQQIIVKNEKDGFDSANSFLDVLLKLGALGSMQ